jgi:hypothetical protein
MSLWSLIETIKEAVRTDPIPVDQLRDPLLQPYLEGLAKEVGPMPFMYTDLEGAVLEDFVSVQIAPLDSNTLEPLAARPHLTTNTIDKLQRFSRIVLSGSAGIGKTTFQRHAALTLATNQCTANFVYPKDTYLPVYVPLKLLSNLSPGPIVDYITNNVFFFTKHPRPSEILLDLATRKKLFLFLDGYDEISTHLGKRNYIQEELFFLFDATAVQLKRHADVEQVLYGALRHCRIWLSTRREFLHRNPIGELGAVTHNRTYYEWETGQPAAVMQLEGVGDNRAALVSNLFNKYRSRSPSLAPLLEEEYFLKDIATHGAELIDFSYNPLFLTVMCYVYVTKVFDEKTHAVSWSTTLEDLITRFIDLLLFELDEGKLRTLDMSQAKRDVLLARRNAYRPEKRAFLYAFAFDLFLQGASVFTERELKSKALDFFERESITDASVLLLRELRSTAPNDIDITIQLIYCGIFVIAGRATDQHIYDFPHRRFREVLAANHITTPERHVQLLMNAENPQFTGLIPVFRGLSHFNRWEFQRDSLQHILAISQEGQFRDDARRLTLHFFQQKPLTHDLTEVVEAFLYAAITQPDTAFRISILALRAIQIGRDFKEALLRTAAIARGDAFPNRMALIYVLLFAFDRSALRKCLGDARATMSNDWLSSLSSMFGCFIENDDRLAECVTAIMRDDRTFADFCYLLTRVGRSLLDDPTFYATVTRVDLLLDNRNKTILRWFLDAHSRTHSNFSSKDGDLVPVTKPENPSELRHFVTSKTISHLLDFAGTWDLPLLLLKEEPLTEKEGKGEPTITRTFVHMDVDARTTLLKNCEATLSLRSYQLFSGESLKREMKVLLEMPTSIPYREELASTATPLDRFVKQILTEILNASEFSPYESNEAKAAVTAYLPPQFVDFFA